MKRSQKDPKYILKCRKQCNYGIKLNNQSKQEHFDSLSLFLDSFFEELQAVLF